MADNRQRLASLLGLCRRAGKLSCGHDAAINSIKSGAAHLCLLSEDSSERLGKEFEREISFSQNSIPLRRLDMTMEDIRRATGLKSAVITINEQGFANSVLGILENMTEEVTQ